MSLAIMFYKQPNRRRRKSDEASEENSGEKTSREVFQTHTRTNRTRSIGFPVVISVTIIVLLVSFFQSAIASADTGEQNLLCHSIDPASEVTIGETRVKNIGTNRADVLCAIDLPPSVSTVSARIRLENNIEDLMTRCSFNARSAFGGQARGVPLQANTRSTDNTRNDWFVFASLETAMDDFRYISCDLAPGTAITGLRITARKITPIQGPKLSLNEHSALQTPKTAFVTLQQ